MNKKDVEHFEELLLKAIQAGKQETSGLVMELKSEIKSINHSLQDMKEENERRWVANEDKWKDAEPVIKMGKNINGFSIISKLIIAIAVAIGSLYGIVVWIQHNIINK